MCGLVGIARPAGVSDHDSIWLNDSLSLLAHRGPDDQQSTLCEGNTVLLGHRRLAVIDLTSNASQPMTSARDVTLVFNGEIYNFVNLRKQLSGMGFHFRSNSDTEVILNGYLAWGDKLFAKLNGAFAIALFDARKSTLILARDRAGEKPLFYTHMPDGSLAFASDSRLVARRSGQSGEVDLHSLAKILTVGFGSRERSLFQGVTKVLPGQFLTWSISDPRPRGECFWDLPEGLMQDFVDEDELVQELDQRLSHAVRAQLQSDAPLGILLSGGLDSSLIVSYAAEILSNVRTYTVEFPSYPHLDESIQARLVAEAFGTRHTALDASRLTPDVLIDAAGHFDEPVGDSSIIPSFLVYEAVSKECRVAIGGDGGDELFGGYSYYAHLQSVARLSKMLPQVARNGAAHVASLVLPQGAWGRNALQFFRSDLRRGVPVSKLLFDQNGLSELNPTLFRGMNYMQSWDEREQLGNLQLATRACRADFRTYLPEDILVKTDRTSMAHSVEVRAPFLDVPVIDFAFSKVPDTLRVSGGQRKIILQKLARRRLPGSFDSQRKQGFSFPLGQLLRDDVKWRTIFSEILLDSRDTLFARPAVERLLRGQERGRSNSERLFVLAMVEIWRQQKSRDFH